MADITLTRREIDALAAVCAKVAQWSLHVEAKIAVAIYVGGEPWPPRNEGAFRMQCALVLCLAGLDPTAKALRVWRERGGGR